MNDNKNIVIGLLCTILCVMAVAYAAFSTSLQINGTASITSNWNVAITNIACTPEKGKADGKDIPNPSVSGINSATASIGVSFNQPGDKVTCVVTITNNGSLDAELKTITTTPTEVINGNGKIDNGETALTIDDFIHYTIGQGTNDTAKVGATLTAEGTHTYTIYAEYVNVVDENNNSVALPTNTKSRTVSVSFNYVQKLNNAA